MHESGQLARDVRSSGTRGYLIEGDDGDELVAGVDALWRRKPFFASSFAETIVRGYRSAGSPGPISARECNIVQLVAEGKSNKEIAASLKISVKTVEIHRAHIMAKLNLHSVPQLVRSAIRNHIIEPVRPGPTRLSRRSSVQRAMKRVNWFAGILNIMPEQESVSASVRHASEIQSSAQPRLHARAAATPNVRVPKPSRHSPNSNSHPPKRSQAQEQHLRGRLQLRQEAAEVACRL